MLPMNTNWKRRGKRKKSKCMKDRECFPKISFPDIANYLLFPPSAVTAEEVKCYKTMEAYNYF